MGLSSSHSGRDRILKGESVVGIARAFLAAGTRSVLVTLWAIDDEATMMFHDEKFLPTSKRRKYRQWCFSSIDETLS